MKCIEQYFKWLFSFQDFFTPRHQKPEPESFFYAKPKITANIRLYIFYCLLAKFLVCLNLGASFQNLELVCSVFIIIITIPGLITANPKIRPATNTYRDKLIESHIVP